MSSTGLLALPAPLRRFFALFPLHTYPEDRVSSRLTQPTLWILPPPPSSRLSGDVECLKVQAELALRGIKEISFRWDIHPDGGINGSLPCLLLPDGDLLGTKRILAWVDKVQQAPLDELEGFQSSEAKDESHAWAALLEGIVRRALTVSTPEPMSLAKLVDPPNLSKFASLFQPPLPPLSGITTPLPPSGLHIPMASILIQYREAISAIAERLGDDTWFLGSSSPTSLDAILFAYLHILISSKSEEIRHEVTRRANLTLWETKVAALV